MSNEDLLEKYSDQRTKCLVVTRVMGYLRQVEQFNKGKQAEYRERRFFDFGKTSETASDRLSQNFL